MILLCLLVWATPPVAPSSALPGPVAPGSLSPSSAAPVDWANHAFGMFTLRNGSAEMSEFSANGGPPDHQTWQFERAEAIVIGGVVHTLVLIESDYSDVGVSRASLKVYLFKGRSQIGEEIVVPTESARITVKGDGIIGRWRVGKERFVKRWRITDKGLVSFGRPSRLRPRALGH